MFRGKARLRTAIKRGPSFSKSDVCRHCGGASLRSNAVSANRSGSCKCGAHSCSAILTSPPSWVASPINIAVQHAAWAACMSTPVSPTYQTQCPGFAPRTASACLIGAGCGLDSGKSSAPMIGPKKPAHPICATSRRNGSPTLLDTIPCGTQTAASASAAPGMARTPSRCTRSNAVRKSMRARLQSAPNSLGNASLIDNLAPLRICASLQAGNPKSANATFIAAVIEAQLSASVLSQSHNTISGGVIRSPFCIAIPLW